MHGGSHYSQRDLSSAHDSDVLRKLRLSDGCSGETVGSFGARREGGEIAAQRTVIQWGPLLTSETAHVPNIPLALQTPVSCARCGRKGTIELQHTIKGARISLSWHCTACDAEWPVLRKENVDTE